MNTFSNKIIPIKMLANGQSLDLNIIEVEGERPGPTVYIQSAVHGAEVQGNLLLYQLIDELKKRRNNGKLILVPNANPYGSIQKSGPYTQGRFNPVTGNNFNRNYTDIFSIKKFEKELYRFVEENNQDTHLKQKYKNFIIKCIDTLIEDKKPYGLSDDFYLNILLQKLAAPRGK